MQFWRGTYKTVSCSIVSGFARRRDGRSLPVAFPLAYYLWSTACAFLERGQHSSDLGFVDAQDDEPILGIGTQRNPMPLDRYAPPA